MKLNHIKATFLKQIMDMSHNIGVIIQFAIHPVLLGAMTYVIPSEYNSVKFIMVAFLSSSFISITPMNKVRDIITVDRYMNVLRVFIMSNVKPLEYLSGISIFIILISSCSSLLMGLLGGLTGIALLRYLLVMVLGSASALVLGAAITMQSDKMSASGVAMIAIGLFNTLIPVAGAFSPSLSKIIRYIYTYQVASLISGIYNNTFDWSSVLIIALNLILFLIIFIFSYKNSKLIK